MMALEFQSSGDSGLLQETFYAVDSKGIKMTPTAVPRLSQFGDDIYKRCGNGTSDSQLQTIILFWDVNPSKINEEKENIIKNMISNYRLYDLQGKTVAPVTIEFFYVHIGTDKVMLAEKSRYNENIFEMRVSGSCNNMNTLLTSLLDENADENIFITAESKTQSFDLAYPAKEISFGAAGNLNAFSPNVFGTTFDNHGMACRLDLESLMVEYTSDTYEDVRKNSSRLEVCEVSYDIEFLPDDGHVFTSKVPGGVAPQRKGLTEIINTKSSENKSYGRQQKFFSQSDNVGPLSESQIRFVESFRAFGHYTNKPTGKQEECGYKNLYFKGHQFPASCLDYLD